MDTFKKCLVLCLSAMILSRFCLQQTDGFALNKIVSNLSHHREWESPCPQITSTILDQSYYYLGKGTQTFAFVSADNEYVLKFYRHHRTKHPLTFLRPILPLSLKTKLNQTLTKRQNKRLKDFSSYKLAYDKLAQETGLLYVHLNKTDSLHPSIKLYDKIGVVHTVDLDKMEFLVQKKADPIYSTLQQWIDTEAFVQAKEGLSQLVALLRSRCQKEIFDKDPDLKTNFGFIGKTPIQLDVGRFKINPSCSDPAQCTDELIRITDRLCQWLDDKAPALSFHLRQEIGQEL